MSHPWPASTEAKPRTSRGNARSAAASRLYSPAVETGNKRPAIEDDLGTGNRADTPQRIILPQVSIRTERPRSAEVGFPGFACC